MFNFHTHHTDDVPCILNCSPDDFLLRQDHERADVAFSVGLHPWNVSAGWQKEVEKMRSVATSPHVWTIGECGLDKVRGDALSVQIEAFRAQITIAEEVKKPMVIHCVKAFDELLALRKELTEQCHREGRAAQPWVIHGFRGKPEQAKQLMAKGLLLSFCHLYHVETLRLVFSHCKSASAGEGCSRVSPFFLETDDHPFSVHQIYEQVSRHLGVDVSLLDSLCDPRQTIFHQKAF